MKLNRLKLILFLLMANIITLISTIIYEWGLLEVAIVYWWEFFSIALITLLIIIRAKSIKMSSTSHKITHFQLIKAKTITFLIAMLMYGLFLGGYFFILYYWFNGIKLDSETHTALFVCIALFFIAQFASYYKESNSGIYIELIDDARVMTPFWRVLPMYIMLPLLAMKYEHGINYTFEQFILVLSSIAIIDISMHIVHIDQCNKLVNKSTTE